MRLHRRPYPTGFIAGIPAPLTIGSIELEGGEQVKGFLCEAHAADSGRDVTTSGSWRRYLAERSASPNRPT
ncbi:MAG: allophanate hydrolase-related protein [Gammaproteobacteria bacterium]